MILSPVIRQRYFNANGAPLAGGKLYSYIAGTTTPQATYTDQGSGTPNANPVILDANGEANVWVDPSLVYKFILQDANGVVQWTVDSVYPPGGIAAFVGDTGTGGGGGLVPAPAAGDAAAKKYLGAGGSFIRLPTPTRQAFTATGTTTGYLFTITAGNATVGATYTNNGNTYTVLATIAAGTELFCSQPSAPLASGTLTKSGGTGDATLTFSAAKALATYTTANNALYLKVRMVGAGAGGSGSGGGSSPGNGGAGGHTYFGAGLLKATGGQAGTGNGVFSGNGSAAGSSLGGLSGFMVQGTGGAPGIAAIGSSSAYANGGEGSCTALGGPGRGGNQGAGSAGSANSGSGGGGAGCLNSGATASTSGAGGCSATYLEAIIPSPSSTYYYAVATGGTAGAAGNATNTTFNSAGGAGADGYIEVTEYY